VLKRVSSFRPALRRAAKQAAHSIPHILSDAHAALASMRPASLIRYISYSVQYFRILREDSILLPLASPLIRAPGFQQIAALKEEVRQARDLWCVCPCPAAETATTTTPTRERVRRGDERGPGAAVAGEGVSGRERRGRAVLAEFMVGMRRARRCQP